MVPSVNRFCGWDFRLFTPEKTIVSLGLFFLGSLAYFYFQKYAQNRFRIHPSCKWVIDQKSIKRAVDQFAKVFPTAFQEYNQKRHLLTREGQLCHYKHELQNGLCYGTLAACFQRKKEVEDVLFFQILEIVRSYVSVEEGQYDPIFSSVSSAFFL